MKPKITLLLLFILLGFNNVFSQNPFPPGKPDLRLCGSAPNYYLDYYNCTSNNYTLNNVYLSINVDTNGDGIPDSLADQTCSLTPTPQVFNNVYVVLHYTSNSSSNIENARLFADLSNNGVMSQINYNLGTVSPGQGTRTISGPISWTCGTAINLSRILVVWKTSGSPTELVPYTCADYSKSQCELPGSTVIATPLGVQFNYTVCTSSSPLQSTYNFNDFTNGGIPGYTYLWNFGDGGTSTLADPQHIYLPPFNPSYTVTLTVTDSHLPTHLVSSQTQTIYPPAPITITGNASSGNCSNSNGSISVTPSGGTPPYTYSWSAGGSTTANSGQLAPGTYTVTVTDSFGCFKTQSFTILPGDTTPPTASNPAPITLSGCNGTFPAPDVNVVTNEADNAGVPTVTWVSDGQPTMNGCTETIVRTYKVTDACGLFINVTQNLIRTVDQTPPTASNPASITLSGCNGSFPAPDVAVVNNEADNCGTPLVAFVNDGQPTINGCTETRIRTYSVTDACGNSINVTQNLIRIVDQTNPTASNPAAITLQGCNGTFPAPNIAVVLNEADNCGTPVVAFVNDGQPSMNGCTETTIRTYSVTDTCGNFINVTQNLIRTVDVTPPSIITVGANATINCPAVPVFTPPTGSDTCGAVTINEISDVTTPGTCAGTYIRTKTWDASDACGNHSTPVSQVITVQDNTPPSISAAGANATINCPAVPVFTPPTG